MTKQVFGDEAALGCFVVCCLDEPLNVITVTIYGGSPERNYNGKRSMSRFSKVNRCNLDLVGVKMFTNQSRTQDTD